MQETLFGPQPDPQRKRAGRPPIEISVEKQELIRAALRGGMPRDDIAHVLGIEPTTLRKYFSPFSDIGNTDAARAAVRLRKMGSELLRIAELMQDMARGKGGRDHG